MGCLLCCLDNTNSRDDCFISYQINNQSTSFGILIMKFIVFEGKASAEYDTLMGTGTDIVIDAGQPQELVHLDIITALKKINII
jgi:hypothetical protein